MDFIKKISISKVIDAVKKTGNNKLIPLMSFGLIIGQIGELNNNDENDSSNPIDIIFLRDAEILPFTGNRFKLPVLTVLLDQILGVSSGTLEC